MKMIVDFVWVFVLIFVLRKQSELGSLLVTKNFQNANLRKKQFGLRHDFEVDNYLLY